MTPEQAESIVRPFIERREYVGAADEYREAIETLRKHGIDPGLWTPTGNEQDREKIRELIAAGRMP